MRKSYITLARRAAIGEFQNRSKEMAAPEIVAELIGHSVPVISSPWKRYPMSFLGMTCREDRE
jgi:hypothetical protein